MESMTEIRWHGRGGQGAKTAATFVAEASIHEGKYGQGNPEYGPERMGAPIRGYTRVSDGPVRLHCAIEHPDTVVVLDDTLLEVARVCDGLGPDGVLIVNTTLDVSEVRKRASAQDTQQVWTIDATQISLDELKRDMPNTPMIGALVKVTGVLELETVLHDIKIKFGKKFRADVVEGNVKAIQRAYDEVKKG